MTCKLCEEDKPLMKSHISPSGSTRLCTTINNGFLFSARMKTRRGTHAQKEFMKNCCVVNANSDLASGKVTLGMYSVGTIRE